MIQSFNTDSVVMEILNQTFFLNKCEVSKNATIEPPKFMLNTSNKQKLCNCINICELNVENYQPKHFSIVVFFQMINLMSIVVQISQH